MTTTRRFDFTGTVVAWMVPASIDGKFHAKLVGASARKGSPALLFVAAQGATVEGDVAAASGDVFFFVVGGVPEVAYTSGASQPTTAHGGYNGGGDGRRRNDPDEVVSGGGGASDIRKTNSDLFHRVAVAAGGGGSYADSFGEIFGGHGGVVNGTAGSGTHGGHGGTQIAGGASGGGAATAGALGTGGNGPNPTVGDHGGGGGGSGYYGGGGGDTGDGGGGGSSYTGGMTGVITTTDGAADGPDTPGYILISYNLIPNAPTLVFPTTNFAYDTNQDFRWLFSDDDDGDSQSAYELQYRVGAGAWTTTGKITSTDQFHEFAAGTFAALSGQSVEWQVRTWDQSDAQGPWSASAFATPYPAPPLFAYDPVPVLVSPTPTIEGGRSDAGPIAGYQIVIVDDDGLGNPGPTTISDSGVHAVGSVTSISQVMPEGAYVNGDFYHVLTKIAYPTDVWNAFVDSGAIVANINGPLAPTFTQFPINAWAAVQLSITNPDSDPFPPEYNDIYRTEAATGIETKIATGVPLDSTYYDEGVGLNRPYSYRIEAVTSDGARTSSA